MATRCDNGLHSSSSLLIVVIALNGGKVKLFNCFFSSFSHPFKCLILFANTAENDDPHGNGEALFWTIRMTVISTAINPFLYGILGGRYRKVYAYCFRAVFSKCCRCVRPPTRAEDKPFRRSDRTGTTS